MKDEPYEIAYVLAKNQNPFSEEEIVKPVSNEGSFESSGIEGR